MYAIRETVYVGGKVTADVTRGMFTREAVLACIDRVAHLHRGVPGSEVLRVSGGRVAVRAADHGGTAVRVWQVTRYGR